MWVIKEHNNQVHHIRGLDAMGARSVSMHNRKEEAARLIQGSEGRYIYRLLLIILNNKYA